MDDLISRQAAIDALQKEINKGIPPFDDVMGSIRCGVRLARNIIEDLPSAKSEVIRCGQCKYAKVADPEDSQDGYTCQFHRGSIWFSGSYCSWAERWEENE